MGRVLVLLTVLATTTALLPGAPVFNRRTALTGAGGALFSWNAAVAPVSADGLSEADKAAILERARTNKLETGKVLERARSGELFDGASATCEEIANIVAVDQKALKQEQELAKVMAKVKKGSQTGALNGMLAGEEARVKAINEKLSKAITNLSSEQAKKCGLL